MFLERVAQLGLAQHNRETDVLGGFPQSVCRLITTSVVQFLYDASVPASTVLPTPTHVRWVMEAVGQGMKLPIDQAPTIEMCITLYSKWIREEAVRPLCINATFESYAIRMAQQMSLLFDYRSKTKEETQTHAALCLRVLEAFSSLSRMRLSLATYEARTHFHFPRNPCIDVTQQQELLKLALGIADSVLSPPTTDDMALGKLIAQKVLASCYEMWFASRCGNVELWDTFQTLHRGWWAWPEVVSHWSNSALMMTQITLDSVYFPGKTRTLPSSFTDVMLAQRLDISYSATVFNGLMNGMYACLRAFLETTRVCDDAPDGNTLLHVFGAPMLEALSLNRPGYEDGTSVAVAALCDLLHTCHRSYFASQYLAAFYHGIKTCLSVDSDLKVISAVINHSKKLLDVDLPGYRVLVPFYMRTIEKVFFTMPQDKTKDLRSSCLGIIARLLSLPNRFQDAAFPIAVPSENAALPTLVKYYDLEQHFGTSAPHIGPQVAARYCWNFMVIVFKKLQLNVWPADVCRAAVSALTNLTAVYKHIEMREQALKYMLDTCSRDFQAFAPQSPPAAAATAQAASQRVEPKKQHNIVAEAAMECMLSFVNNSGFYPSVAGPERVSSLITEELLISKVSEHLHIPLNEACNYARFYCLEDSTLISFVDAPFMKTPAGLTTFVIIRDRTGKYVWQAQLKLLPTSATTPYELPPSAPLYDLLKNIGLSKPQIAMIAYEEGLAQRKYGHALYPVDASSMYFSAVKQLDQQPERECMKAAIVYHKGSQETEDEMLLNEHGKTSADYQHFIWSLGWPVKLTKHRGFSAGLDKRNGTTGDVAPYYADCSTELMFHVATLIPNNQTNMHKKRLISKDYVLIVWSENGLFDDESLDSSYHHLKIIITPLKGSGLYSTRVYRSEKIVSSGPLSTMVLSKHSLGALVRAAVIDAYRAAKDAVEGPTRPYALRQRIVADIIKRYRTEQPPAQFYGNLLFHTEKLPALVQSPPLMPIAAAASHSSSGRGRLSRSQNALQTVVQPVPGLPSHISKTPSPTQVGMLPSPEKSPSPSSVILGMPAALQTSKTGSPQLPSTPAPPPPTQLSPTMTMPGATVVFDECANAGCPPTAATAARELLFSEVDRWFFGDEADGGAENVWTNFCVVRSTHGNGSVVLSLPASKDAQPDPEFTQWLFPSFGFEPRFFLVTTSFAVYDITYRIRRVVHFGGMRDAIAVAKKLWYELGCAVWHDGSVPKCHEPAVSVPGHGSRKGDLISWTLEMCEKYSAEMLSSVWRGDDTLAHTANGGPLVCKVHMAVRHGDECVVSKHPVFELPSRRHDSRL
eukprot:m51a1_g10936 hypothetical protein (1316) ;mRNA; r:156656-163696